MQPATSDVDCPRVHMQLRPKLISSAQLAVGSCAVMKSTGLALCAFLALVPHAWWTMACSPQRCGRRPVPSRGTVMGCDDDDERFAIMCYECNSATNTYCSAAVLPENLQRNCSENDRGLQHTLCRKIIQQVDYEVNGHVPSSRVIRSCGWDDSKYKGVCYHRSGYGGRQEVCSCSSDLCNSSPNIPGPLGLILTSLTVYTTRII